MTARALAIALAITCAASPVGADPPPNLKLEREPRPRHLRMRPRAAQGTTRPSNQATTPRSRTPMPAAPSARGTDLQPIAGIDGVRDIRQPVSFSVALGYQIDGARPNGRSTLGGPAPVTGKDYETLRAYGFGEVFLSTRGVGVQSLSSYFALRFQAARRLTVDRADITADDPMQPDGEIPLASPIATWFERSGGELRTGWGELKDFLPKRWGLRRLRIRVGDQYIYGPWVVHLFGSNIAYEGPTLTSSIFWGLRRSDYTRALEDGQPGAFGASLRFDLRGLTDAVPIAVTGEYLGFSASDHTGQPGTSSGQFQIDWRPKRDVAVIGQVRSLDGELANQRLEVRTRYKEVTNLVFDVMRRRETDWRWDPTIVVRDRTDLTEARRYLDLGPPRPQILFSLRGGTLIAENVDLFARVAASSDQADDDEAVQSFSASYLELGGALEVRLRRQMAFGMSILTRTTERVVEAPIVDERDVTQPLPPSEAMGEDGFTEIGSTLRLSLGARRFSALLELYGRRTRYSLAYVDPLLPLADSDVRGGGRFTLDAWVGKRIRLFASYDVSSQLDQSPEITGYKSLRLTMTGVY
ncbi:MAG: hypothetical protein H0T89_03370 [Deltaproteobacteria bacterium]|nr:hypothetical protein [Deltaproteobacteria bacterium]